MEQLVNFKTAKLAKELGFDIPVQDRYKLINWQFPEIGVILNDRERRFGGVSNWNHECFQDKYRQYTSAPTQSELQKWLREKYNRYIIITHNFNYNVEGNLRQNENLLPVFTSNTLLGEREGMYYKTYEDALEHALYSVLQGIIKEEK